MNDFTRQYAPVIWVTLAYVCLYYLFLLNLLRTRLMLIKRCKDDGKPFRRYDDSYPELRAADRTQLNMLEHMPTFLVVLWLQAFTVSANAAAICGGMYTLIRATYPFFMGARLENKMPNRLFINTFAGYAVHFLMMGWIGYELLSKTV